MAEYFSCKICGVTRMAFAGGTCTPCMVENLRSQLKDAEEVIRVIGAASEMDDMCDVIDKADAYRAKYWEGR